MGARVAERFELVEDGLGRGVAVGGVGGKEAVDDAGEAAVHVRRGLGEGGGGPARLTPEHLAGVLPREGRAAGEDAEEGGAQRVEVAARPVLAVADLLGRCVAGGAEAAAPVGLLRDVVREAEIGDAHLPLAVDQDVAWLDVAMDDARLVRCGQGATDLSHVHQRLLRVERTLAGEDGAQALTVHELHGEVTRAIALPCVVGLDDVGVSEARGGARLAEEALHEDVVVGQVPREDLQRHHAVHGHLARLEHDPHAATADVPEDLESRQPPRLPATCSAVVCLAGRWLRHGGAPSGW